MTRRAGGRPSRSPVEGASPRCPTRVSCSAPSTCATSSTPWGPRVSDTGSARARSRPCWTGSWPRGSASRCARRRTCASASTTGRRTCRWARSSSTGRRWRSARTTRSSSSPGSSTSTRSPASRVSTTPSWPSWRAARSGPRSPRRRRRPRGSPRWTRGWRHRTRARAQRRRPRQRRPRARRPRRPERRPVDGAAPPGPGTARRAGSPAPQGSGSPSERSGIEVVSAAGTGSAPSGPAARMRRPRASTGASSTTIDAARMSPPPTTSRHVSGSW